ARAKLVRSDRGVVLTGQLRTLDDVVETAGLGIPEALVERAPASFGVRVELTGALLFTRSTRPFCEETQRVVPERVDLDGLAAPWRDDPPVALRVHPRELIAPCALDEEPVFRIDVNAEARALEMAAHDLRQLRPERIDRRLVARRLEVAIDGVKEPERRVCRVVEALVAAVGEHVGDEAVSHVLTERV